MQKYPFYAALGHLSDFYGIELDEDTFETYALSAYRKIGNRDQRFKLLRAKPERDANGGWSICKPCDMDEIEAITLPFETGQEVSATDNYLAYKTYDIENWIEDFKRNKDEFYLPGAFVKYWEFQDKIYFTQPYQVVNILYRANYTDEDGLPYLSEKEIEAISAYCAFSYDNKKGRVNKDADMLQIAQQEFQTWSRLCSSARVADGFSQNEMNEILDILTSMDVHSYNVSSTKPIK